MVFGLWRSCGSGFMARWWNGRAGEALGRCGACQRSERAAGSALIGNCHPRAKMGRLAALRVFHREPSRSSRFHNRRRRQAAEAARFTFSRLWCLGGLMMESRALRADIRAHFVAKKFPCGRKMTPPDLPHLLHPVSPVHILSDS